jgi:hypothetical protein
MDSNEYLAEWMIRDVRREIEAKVARERHWSDAGSPAERGRGWRMLAGWLKSVAPGGRSGTTGEPAECEARTAGRAGLVGGGGRPVRSADGHQRELGPEGQGQV